MKRNILLLAMSVMAASSAGQFSGGSGDGHGAFVTAPVTLNQQSFYCSGGNGDGHNLASSGVEGLANQVIYCSGGNGDGHVGAEWQGLLFQQDYYCSGGNGDGSVAYSTGQGTLNEQTFYCSGGNGDGHHFGPSGESTLFEQFYYCSGGNGDGHILSEWSGPLFESGYYCSGGTGDGNSSSQSASTAMGTGRWKGTASTQWTNASNWVNSVVPDQSTDVVIPGGCPHYPVLTSGILSVNSASGLYKCKSLTIAQEASVALNTYGMAVAGTVSLFGSFTATNNSDNAIQVQDGGSLKIRQGSLMNAGNQSGTTGLCDLKVFNGGSLLVEGGTLYIDDELNIMPGGSFTMTDGIVFAHRYGIGSDYDASSPGAFFIAPGAGGSVTGGMVKVNGKASNGIYSAVGIYAGTFGFSSSGKLKITDGDHASLDISDIRNASGVTLNKITIDKPFRTVSIATPVHALGDLVIMPHSHLEIRPTATLTVDGDMIIIE